MPRRPFVPDDLRHRPFLQSEGLALGLSVHKLNGAAWTRIFPRVWVHRDHEMSRGDWITAATLAMPTRAQLSHVSRIQALGLDIGDVKPVHFTVSGDLHLAVDDVFLHRTEVLPPLDDVGVTPAAAFIQYCATARLIDAIEVGDWLLHRRHITVLEVSELARRDAWRPGARQVRRALPYLDAAARSLKESETRALVVFSGLPVPEVNVPLIIAGERIGVVDLLIRCVMLVLEYEGRQHAESIRQFNRDITRYAAFRRNDVEYLQVTNEMLDRPKTLVQRIHARMVELGYAGPPPVFADRWDALFAVIPSSGASVAQPEPGWATNSPLRLAMGD
ncbi:hypothetical protein ASE12_15675 [Aeromicrobium sp. Root236]|uniref:hypothetical protein n=1 Tax=Aeromicrobium sp. Root236 TaxID=1736498 RepID=UPI0006F29822|nr:hypothetical protein [Aeromicrobium sp. Root236]KRC66068.1 hypothetical protein ASE12_15675 [Aeromicrobium sp. Root236]